MRMKNKNPMKDINTRFVRKTKRKCICGGRLDIHYFPNYDVPWIPGQSGWFRDTLVVCSKCGSLHGHWEG
jgi:hypothetical protein